MTDEVRVSMLPTRKTIRMRGYDYTLTGAYLITICAFDRAHLFGKIVDGEMVLSPLGQLVRDELLALSGHYPGYLILDAFVVMPNHLRCLVFFVRPVDSTEPPRTPLNLSNVVRLFKAGVTYKWRQLSTAENSAPIWQSHFHDHVIRHERALERVQDYIVNNPQQWELDRENAAATGTNEFYRWIEAYGKKIAALDMDVNIR